jgi:hypothetical protein
MRSTLAIPLALTVLVSLMIAGPVKAAERQLAHMVYFKLQDGSPEAKEKLVAACKKYLAGHEGTVFFAAGVLADDLNRDVNDRDFDVSLHLVFESKAAHDKYADHPRHLEFIAEHKENWTKVRVFDSYLAGGRSAERREGRPAESREGRPTERREGRPAEGREGRPTERREGRPAEGREGRPTERREGDRVGQVPLPDPAANFAGMIVAKILAKPEGRLVVHVEKVAKVWERNRAKDPQSLVDKRVQVNAGEGELIGKFLRAVQVGETVELDVAHKRGDALTILELTPDQRARVK